MLKYCRARPVECLLFALLFFTSTYFYQGCQHNEAARFDHMRAIAYDHTLAIDKYWWNTADVIHYTRNGKAQVYPNKAPGGTVIGVLPFAVISCAIGFLQPLGVPEWMRWELSAYLTTIVTVGLLSAAAAVAMYRLLRSLIGDSYFSVLAVLAVWLGTLCLPYSTLFFSHQLVAALLCLAFVTLFFSTQRRKENGWSSIVAGLLLGLSVITEYPTVLLAGVISCYFVVVWIRQSGKQALSAVVKLIAGGAIAGLLLISYNLVAFGKFIYVPLEAYAAAGTPFETYKHGILGLQWRGLGAFLHALDAILIQPKIGMLYLGVGRRMIYACSPVLWLVLPGLAVMWWKGRRGEMLLITALIAAYLLFITSYGTWEYDWAGGSYFGSRHLVPLLPFLAIPLAFGAKRLRYLFYPLFALSVFYMLIATAVEPRLGYPADNPMRQVFWPEFLRGHFAQNTAPLANTQGHYLTSDSIAFNLAKLLGVPGRYQLVPLLAFWAVAGGLLLTLARDNANGRPGLVVAIVCSAMMLPPIVHAARASESRPPSHGLLGKYYRNANWVGKPSHVRVDRHIDFDWSHTMPLQPPFSVVWEGLLNVDTAGEYTFFLVADDGAALDVDGATVVDVLKEPAFTRKSGTRYLTKGEHPIRIRYVNLLFGGSVRLWWRSANRPEQIIPEDAFVPPHTD